VFVTAYQTSLLGAGDPVVDPTVPFERLWLDDLSWVDVARGWLHGADTLLDALIESVDWEQHRRWMYERMVDDPRLSRWISADEPLPHPALTPVRSALEAHYDVPLGGIGLNYYRDGRDSVAPHRDRELRHLDDTLIAIVTLGARRPFLLRPKQRQENGRRTSIDLAPASGDLLVMGGAAQMGWEHGVPKVRRAGPRISATWRWATAAGSR
jgi:alkylated DNA repair dioxygenase AlkB